MGRGRRGVDRRYLASTLSDLSMGSESIMSVCYCELEYGVLRTVFVSYFFVIVTVIVTVIVPYAMFILLL